MLAAARRFSGSLQALRAVLRNRDLRRTEIALVGFGIAEYATWVAILVYAYEAAGPTGAGLAAVIQLVPSAVVAPLASALGDSMGGRRFLLIGYAVQAVAMAAVATALEANAAVPVIFGLAAVAATTVTLTRPSQWAIQASLARTPEELTAANVMASSIDSASVLVGPALAGILLALSEPGLVFAVASAALLVSAALVVRVERSRAPALPVSFGGMIRGFRAGFADLVAEPGSKLLVGLIASRSVLIGALDVLTVVLAFRLLGMGRPGAGYLNAAFGGGALIGAALAILLVGRSGLSGPLRRGLALFGLSLAAIAALPHVAFAFVALAVGGIGGAVADVAGRTLLQRLVPEHILSRAFGVLEGVNMAALAVGSIAVPLLIGAFGVRWTVVAVGGVLPALAVLAGSRLRTADQSTPVATRRLDLLRGIGTFGALDPPTLERLAAALVPMDAEPGTAVVRQGQVGDRLYIVAEGELDVTVEGRPAPRLGPGDSFGEVALLRNVPRTATVTARTFCRLYWLEREDFLSALAANPAAAARAESQVRTRLAADHPATPTEGT